MLSLWSGIGGVAFAASRFPRAAWNVSIVTTDPSGANRRDGLSRLDGSWIVRWAFCALADAADVTREGLGASDFVVAAAVVVVVLPAVVSCTNGRDQFFSLLVGS